MTSASQASIYKLSKVRAAQYFLLLNLMLTSFQATACSSGGIFSRADTVLFLLEVALFGFAYSGLWLKRKFWPAQGGATSSAWFYGLLIAASLTAIMLALMGILVIPAYEKLFASLGIELPAVTQFVINFRYVLILPIVVVVILWRWSKNNPQKEKSFAYLLLFEMALALFVLWAPSQAAFVMDCAG